MGKDEISLNAESFVRDFWRVYLQERNVAQAMSFLSPQITWIKANEQQVYTNYEQVEKFLTAEKQTHGDCMEFDCEISQNYEAGGCRFISGTLAAKDETCPCAKKHLFSITLSGGESTWKICALHYSLPDRTQSGASEAVLKCCSTAENDLVRRDREISQKIKELETLTDNLHGGIQICAFDEDFTIKYISKGFTNLSGFTRQELFGLFSDKYVKLVDAHDLAHVKADIRSQLESQNNYSVEYRIVCKDGKSKWVMDKGELFMREDGGLEIHSIISDISVYKEQQEALKISKKCYEVALKSSSLVMFEYNILTRELIFFNDVASMYGVPSVVPNGVETFIKNFIEPVSEPEYREMYRKIHNGEPDAKCFIKSRDKNGVVHDFMLHLTNVFDDDGNPVRAIGVRSNVSQMKLLERETEFGKNMVAGKTLIFEAGITLDYMEFLHPDWRVALKLTPKLSYTAIIKQICQKLIHPDYADNFLYQLSVENLKHKYAGGENLITFEYKSRAEDGEYKWFEAIVNIIRDLQNDYLSLRFYRMDISETKRKQQRALEEQKLYESMLSDAKRAYAINISRNIFISGHEQWEELFGINFSDNYSELIAGFAHSSVHPDDAACFFGTYKRENILAAFAAGGQQLVADYRLREANGEYRWNHCIMHLYDDPTTSDIKAFAYIQDIDEHKREEINLKFMAEHDVMTGIYNKATLENMICALMCQKLTYAFLIVDIDNFKAVNDTFGHVFGDKVIKDIAAKLKKNFGSDILGRLGGDEFCIFIEYADVAEIKKSANRICTVLNRTYKQKGESVKVTASVGISLFPENAKDFAKLYCLADEALYRAKKNGKNRYSFYE